MSDKEKEARERMDQTGSFDYDKDVVEKQVRSGGYGLEEGQVAFSTEGDRPGEVNRPKASLARLKANFDPDVDDGTARRTMRRLNAYEDLLQGLANRQEPTGRYEYITLEKASALMEDYKQAKDEGYTDNKLDIVPLSSYYAKIFPEGKKPVRPLIQNEWGVINRGRHAGTVLVLRDRDAGNAAPLVAVPQHISPTQPQVLTAQGVPHKDLLPGPGDG